MTGAPHPADRTIGAPAQVLTSELVSRAFDASIEVERTVRGSLVVHPAAARVDHLRE